MKRYRIVPDERDEPLADSHDDYMDALARRPSRRLGTKDVVIIGATTLAGVGLGLMAALGGAFALTAVGEAVLAPTLLLKVAGGMAGGGVGLAKGINDTRNDG